MTRDIDNMILPPLLKKMTFWLLYVRLQKNNVLAPTTVLWMLMPLPYRSMHRELMMGPFDAAANSISSIPIRAVAAPIALAALHSAF
jgi:hypothetical protein